MLSAEKDFLIVGEAEDAQQAIRLTNELRPDVVLMDIGMTGLSSFDATREIKRSRPETKVLFVSMYDDRDYVREAMQSGASGYLLKDTPARELIGAIRKIAGGGSHMTPRMLSQLMEDLRASGNQTGAAPTVVTLTGRERQILKLLAEGHSTKTIAAELNLSVKTVDAHKTNLMRKLDVHNRSQLVQYAIQKKIVPAAGYIM